MPILVKWQGWICGLVHCPGGNTSDPIWRVLASFNGISAWTPLKPQPSNPNANPLANQLWCSIHVRWSISYVSVACYPSFKLNLIAYRSSKESSRPNCIFEIHQRWQSGFSKVYSNCCCSCSFAAEIIKIGLSSHKMYNNNKLNLSSVFDNFKCLYKKKVWKLIERTAYMKMLSIS